MALELRDYQHRAISALRDSYASGHRSPVLVLPTGGGKTVVAAAIIQGALARGNRSLFVAPRRELINQTVRKLADAGIWDVRVIQAANDTGRPDAPVIVGSIQTLTMDRWLGHLPQADLVIPDECHHLVSDKWSQLAGAYPSARWLGLTATPQRSDGRPLGDVFDDMVVAASVRELTDLGYLVPCRVFAPPDALDTAQLALDPVGAYQQHGAGQRAIVFCVTVEHARQVAADFNAAGIVSDLVVGTSPAQQRADTLTRFASGEIRALVNVNVLTEGFDDPPVAVCILARKPQHAGTFLQMAGRVLRPAPGKTQATLIDLCGSVHEHGVPALDREYSLDGKAITGAKRDAIRQCPTCGAVFLAAPTCPECGAELPRRPAELPRITGVGVVDLATLPRAPARAFTVSITARYAGRCRLCDGRIAPGDQIYWAKGDKPRHVECRAEAA